MIKNLNNHHINSMEQLYDLINSGVIQIFINFVLKFQKV